MTETIRVNETFTSLQGECRNVGHVSTFIRLFGCNLKCPGFSLPKGQPNTEIPMIIKNIDQYKCYEDLPLSKTGCDSYPSSWSEFKRFSIEYTFEQLYQKMQELANNNPNGMDLVFTGGEPLLKPSQKKLVKFFDQYINFINQYSSITFETNGTQSITDEMKDWLVNRCKIPVLFSVSPKLECSGESEKRRLVPSAVESINQTVKQICANKSAVVNLKYVVKDEDDVLEALDNANKLGFKKGIDGDIYLMPVGGTYDDYMNNQKLIAELSIKYRCIFCCRIHQIIWSNSWSR